MCDGIAIADNCILLHTLLPRPEVRCEKENRKGDQFVTTSYVYVLSVRRACVSPRKACSYKVLENVYPYMYPKVFTSITQSPHVTHNCASDLVISISQCSTATGKIHIVQLCTMYNRNGCAYRLKYVHICAFNCVPPCGGTLASPLSSHIYLLLNATII